MPRARLRAMLGHYSEESGGEWGGECGVREKSVMLQLMYLEGS